MYKGSVITLLYAISILGAIGSAIPSPSLEIIAGAFQGTALEARVSEISTFFSPTRANLFRVVVICSRRREILLRSEFVYNLDLNDHELILTGW
jgi:hypothetical protein